MPTPYSRVSLVNSAARTYPTLHHERVIFFPKPRGSNSVVWSKQQSIRLSSTPMNPTVQARLKFLDTAAQFYSSTAPATSAQLMRERQDFVADHNIKLREAEVRGLCQACGTIVTPGSTSQTCIVFEPIISGKSRSQRRKHAAQIAQVGGETDKIAIRKCLACHRITRTPMLLPSKPSVGNVGRQSSAQGASQPDSLPGKADKSEGCPVEDKASQQPSLANSSSKKRAKARKPGGLQVMLDRYKAAQNQPFSLGLDLMDIMKAHD